MSRTKICFITLLCFSFNHCPIKPFPLSETRIAPEDNTGNIFILGRQWKCIMTIHSFYTMKLIQKRSDSVFCFVIPWYLKMIYLILCVFFIWCASHCSIKLSKGKHTIKKLHSYGMNQLHMVTHKLMLKNDKIHFTIQLSNIIFPFLQTKSKNNYCFILKQYDTLHIDYFITVWLHWHTDLCLYDVFCLCLKPVKINWTF